MAMTMRALRRLPGAAARHAPALGAPHAPALGAASAAVAPWAPLHTAAATPPLRPLAAAVLGQRSGGGARSLFIQTEKTPNPSTLKFIPSGVQVLAPSMGTGVFIQKGDRDYQQSPLAVRLFKLEGVASVFLGADFVTVGRDPAVDWVVLKPQIFALLMDAFDEEGFEAYDPAAGTEVVSDTTIFDDDDEVVAMVKELLETRIRPAVQEDGGDIFYVAFDEGTGVVKVRLAGSCQGCPSSSVTLKSGVENMLMHYIPEVTAVEAVDEDVARQEEDQAAFQRSLDRSKLDAAAKKVKTTKAKPKGRTPEGPEVWDGSSPL